MSNHGFHSYWTAGWTAMLFGVLNPIAGYCGEAERLKFFEQKIRPVLVEHCYPCHSNTADKIKGGLLLDSQAGMSAGGDSGEAIVVPGNARDSLLRKAIAYEDGLDMPPEGPLPAAIVRDFDIWITDGAYDPRVEQIAEARRADKSWWSLQPLRTFEQQSPEQQSSAQQSSAQQSQMLPGARIDAFVDEKLATLGLKVNSLADPRTLIRRMNYDLLGLPPTPQQVSEFERQFAENAQKATEKLVDRLLDSQHYGEHWGRHWLDVVRFGESNGFERNVIIDDLWPFRDYVIESLNDDKPFDQFIVEHLAGDVIGKGNPSVEVGTAFLVAGPYDDVGNQDVAAQANIRAATLDEIITATSGAFLGLTVNCARCHNHKFDPIPAEDYYRLRAAFEGVEHGRRILATEAEREQHAKSTQPLEVEKQRLTEQLNELEKVISERALEQLASATYPRPKVDQDQTVETFAPISARFVKLSFLAHTDNPRSATGSRLTECEVWTTGDSPRNVALATVGGKAEGARSATAQDFQDAYGPQLTIDGAKGEQWFIGNPAELTITLAQTETIDRVLLCNSKGLDLQDKARGETPCEYEIHVSQDGQQWQTVASSFDRQPWSEAHGIERWRADITKADEADALRSLRQQLRDVQARLSQVPALPTVWVGNRKQPDAPTRLHIVGDPMKQGEVVAPASLAVLDQTAPAYELPADADEGQRRLALARWLVSEQNPITARVLANRVWHYHFGTGLVDTPSDFGFLGGQPTHPELLDWLATQLIAGGWRLKSLHREILLSKTYRQSSQFNTEAAELDSESRLLWRFPPRRLSAEEIRDTFLFVSGQLRGLDRLASGPGFRLYEFTQNNVCTYFPLSEHGPDTYRRSVYHQNARASVVDLLTDFDLPDNAFAAPVRASTTTPLQALTLLNHSFTLDSARALAARAAQQSNTSDPAQIVDAIYKFSLQRAPRPDEMQAACQLFEHHGAAALCRAILNANEVLYVE